MLSVRRRRPLKDEQLLRTLLFRCSSPSARERTLTPTASTKALTMRPLTKRHVSAQWAPIHARRATNDAVAGPRGVPCRTRGLLSPVAGIPRRRGVPIWPLPRHTGGDGSMARENAAAPGRVHLPSRPPHKETRCLSWELRFHSDSPSDELCI